MPSPTPMQRRALARIRAEGSLCVQHCLDGDTYFLPSGRPVNARTAQALIAQGAVTPSGDGPWDDTQTYVPREAADARQ